MIQRSNPTFIWRFKSTRPNAVDSWRRLILRADAFCPARIDLWPLWLSPKRQLSLDAVRPLLGEALKTFRTEGPKGWSFTQTSRGEGHSRVERYDAAQPEFDRWTLLQQDDRPPTPEEPQDYREKLSRRSRGGTAPKLTDQLDLTTLTLSNETDERATLRAHLKPGEAGMPQPNTWSPR